MTEQTTKNGLKPRVVQLSLHEVLLELDLPYSHRAWKDFEALLEALERIAIASEFHAQPGISDGVMRYAHESTKRLAEATIARARGQDND